ncbi:hypothetical protein BCR33DRAFT_132493 [Rhizoclosmatium globosum]|uniref:Uncharacterized protein n=1 Tax=Rhizoclosmatium globosum TaxID=329046 RepID=A0A1Y2CIH0_9FUNG|nr:hypothetical protein BCR33DRAFT_132493 [Rhizoclosmatium globosum]|eukprot:ORY46624.1 hypothetical protein BCR33DRAFT_132493 [Rhizoclosmatium globosum]
MDKTDVDLVSLLTESIELQHTFMILQRQITSGLSRVNKVVEMVSKLPTNPTSLYSAGGSRSRNPSQQIVSSRIMEGSGFGVDFDRYMTTQSSINSLSNQASSIQQRSNQITSELLLSCTPSSQRSINHVLSPVNTSNNSLVEIQRLSEAIRWDGMTMTSKSKMMIKKQPRSDTTTIEVPFGEMKLIPKPIARTNSKKTSPLVRQTVLNSVVMGVDSEQSRSSVISFKERVSQVFRSGPRSTLSNCGIQKLVVSVLEQYHLNNLLNPTHTKSFRAAHYNKTRSLYKRQSYLRHSRIPSTPNSNIKLPHAAKTRRPKIITPESHRIRYNSSPPFRRHASKPSPHLLKIIRLSTNTTHRHIPPIQRRHHFPIPRDTKLHNATSKPHNSNPKTHRPETPVFKPIQRVSVFNASLDSRHIHVVVTCITGADEGPCFVESIAEGGF